MKTFVFCGFSLRVQEAIDMFIRTHKPTRILSQTQSGDDFKVCLIILYE
jgi:hypothetical protein